MTRYLAIIATIILTTGCSGISKLSKVNVEPPTQFDNSIMPLDSMSIADMDWYEFYTDSILRSMIKKALDNNRDLLSAAAKIEEMRALMGETKASYLPEIGATVGGDSERTDYSGNGWDTDNEFSLKATLNWEYNLWNAMKWGNRKGKASYEASIEDMRAMHMTLIANTATAYFYYTALNNELSIVKETLQTREEALEKARLRYEGGLTPETVYQQAKVEYATTASLIPNLEQQITNARNALTLLMGEMPAEALPYDTSFTTTVMPDDVSVGIPSDLLQRRPDIRAASKRLSAAMANVGLTYANRFPSFRINLVGGLENSTLTDFLKSPYTYILGNIAGPIFDFGKRKKKYQASIALYDQARYDYEKTVIKAFTEVNSALTAYHKYRDNYTLKTDLRDAALKYVDLAQLQYMAGSLNYIDVLDARRRYFDAQIGVSNALLDRYRSVINLYKALGGGW